ncbi:hypothetical protein [Streptomyces chromofuscus]|uniref:Uncharacterized protein n=1 Tax=Streptomyces chromofuscus TaxID=42881 RepID=A0A7M2T571_STRCW|nr:hypothetical protein [Streptomyces chromofuscus]QOV43045.1 hypothetical protein IPT68_25165 [Streptomyces chromofuscus]GGS93316.1 hypothetical protein GCM10010254_11590 [Streptomyces chromofuscus]
MQRLAFIRLLAQQGMEQSRLPDPLAASCILTFHDAVELFLVLASEHLGITIPDKGQFVARYFETMHPDKAGPAGVDLAGKIGVKRLTVQRNSFKHDAALPAGPTIEQARVDTKQFFEENTPRVFGHPFDGIDMVELIPQEPVREQLRAASAVWAQGDHANGMGLLRLAFEELFEQHINGDDFRGSPLAFGRQVRQDPFLGGKVAKALTLDEKGKYAPVPPRLAESVGRHVQDLTETVAKMQSALRVTSLGIDYHRYHRFEHLTPEVSRLANGRREAYPVGPYAPRDEDFEYCQQFVVSAALRLAEMEAHLARPAWRE